MVQLIYKHFDSLLIFLNWSLVWEEVESEKFDRRMDRPTEWRRTTLVEVGTFGSGELKRGKFHTVHSERCYNIFWSYQCLYERCFNISTSVVKLYVKKEKKNCVFYKRLHDRDRWQTAPTWNPEKKTRSYLNDAETGKVVAFCISVAVAVTV